MSALSASDAGAGPRPIGRGVLLLLALAAGVVAGCPLELDRGVSCGDGWWDPDNEQCDPRDPASYINACRAQGFAVDAECDPESCEVRASEADCTVCGDNVASGDEECDGNDLRGRGCEAGSGVLRCTDACTFDYDGCPEVCGDEVVNGTEECEPNLSCGDDSDCTGDRVCYQLFGECVAAGENFAPNLSCRGYNTKAIGISKGYVSGTIDRCTDECFFGRNNCGFCGDDQLDGEYSDLVFPSGEPVTFPAEVCDGAQAQPELLEAYCEPLCIDEPTNSDVVVLCDFECNADCTGFAGPSDVVPDQNPEAIGCCLAKGSPCPNFDTEGVPNFPCCSWLDNPKWFEDKKCVAADTGQIPITYVCP
ncbi:hypothetical protein ENSA5_10680 [Enhygromyxa salina]|uniref:Uncharacterized protein n=1 Tax=Enhygromyxa salina TaxID=215803 RepID=A0A2S9YG84_9BACT|nr:hypothetical protein [Enhygromyxa salina]PRQ04109.1 hypothetical protein ENSA5_10680 [Enhygromyxa salina]